MDFFLEKCCCVWPITACSITPPHTTTTTKFCVLLPLTVECPGFHKALRSSILPELLRNTKFNHILNSSVFPWETDPTIALQGQKGFKLWPQCARFIECFMMLRAFQSILLRLDFWKTFSGYFISTKEKELEHRSTFHGRILLSQKRIHDILEN